MAEKKKRSLPKQVDDVFAASALDQIRQIRKDVADRALAMLEAGEDFKEAKKSYEAAIKRLLEAIDQSEQGVRLHGSLGLAQDPLYGLPAETAKPAPPAIAPPGSRRRSRRTALRGRGGRR